MIAIVVTLGGYLAGLQWLVTPPDPWQSNPKAAQLLQHTARKRVTPAQADVTAAASLEPDIRFASIEPSASAQASAPETVRPAEANGAPRARPTVEPAHIMRREVSPPKARPGKRNRVERNTSRKLELMVLRTYERSDGKRFTRLLPLNSARNDLRNALAFQPDDPW
jgi:hypothetical protein